MMFQPRAELASRIVPLPIARPVVSNNATSKVPICLRDRLSHEFLTVFGDNVNSPRAKAFLEFHAALISMDIGGIEARHASNRRWLVKRSTQTHPMTFSRLSAEWLLQQTRRLNASLKKAQHGISQARGEATQTAALSASRKRTRTSACQEAVPRKRRPTGGGQRAYISEQIRARRLWLAAPGIAKSLNQER